MRALVEAGLGGAHRRGPGSDAFPSHAAALRSAAAVVQLALYIAVLLSVLALFSSELLRL